MPLVFLLAYTFKLSAKHRLSHTYVWPIVIFSVAITLSIGLYPEELSIDKPRYVYMYEGAVYYGMSYEFRDMGWIAYNTLCSRVFGREVSLFFLFTAAIYFGGFYLTSRLTFPKEYAGYFIIMSAGCLGFTNYGTNVIRAGVAMSLLLLAYSLKTKAVYRILLAFVALSFQKSMIIPIAAYVGAKFFKKTWMVVLIWVGCFFLSFLNFDMGPLFENFGFVDERVEQYAKSLDEYSGNYEAGFRYDFLLYSVVPLVIAFYYISQKKIKDATYSVVLKTFLLANAVWLLAIRIAYSDRLAYLSWFMIPFLCLYPVIMYQYKFKHPQRFLLMVMYVFMGVKLLLSIRNFL